MLSKKRPANPSQRLLQQNPRPRGNWGATLKLIIISGSGLFADGWNLQSVALVIAIMSYKYPHRMLLHKQSMINCVALAGVVVGEFGFGFVGDTLGRKWSAVVTAILSIAGMVAVGCVHDQGYLTITACASMCFFVAGIGIGGEIPLTAAMTKEMGQNLCLSRLALLEINCLVYTVGSICQSFFAFILLSANVGFDVTWRVAAVVGAAPSLVAICFRVYLEEPEAPHPKGKRVSSWYHSSIPILSKPFLLLLAVSVTWSMHGFASFGLFGDTHTVVNALMSSPGDSLSLLVKRGVVIDIVLACLRLVGNLIGAYCIQRGVSLKRIQWIGLVGMVGSIWLCGFCTHMDWLGTFGFCVTALMDGVVVMTLYIVPIVCFPRTIRASAVGMASGIGKVGAVIGAALCPVLSMKYGISVTVIIYGAVAALGIGSTIFMPNTVLQDCRDFF